MSESIGGTPSDRRAESTADNDPSVVVRQTELDAPTVTSTTTVPEEPRSVLRVPTFSPLAPLLGWILAWGAICIATASLERAEVPTGFAFGIAEGGPGDDGFWGGLWLLIVNAGAFLLGGYTAARMARANGTKHAMLVWVVAMLATGADAIIDAARAGEEGVIRLLPGVPFWAETGMVTDGEAALVLIFFAVASLIGAVVGGGLGQSANRADRRDIEGHEEVSTVSTGPRITRRWRERADNA